VKDWNSSGAKVMLKNKEIESSKVGIKKTLDGIYFVLFVPLNSEPEVHIKIVSVN